MLSPITVSISVHAPLERVWQCWTQPEHIMQWCHASDDWHAPRAANDLRVGGVFATTMAATDGSVSFDFGGTYTTVEPMQTIGYAINGDGRKVYIDFEQDGEAVRITETFDPENENPPAMQQAGWQAILENFKKYVEAL